MPFFDYVYDSWKKIQYEKYEQMLLLIKKMKLDNALDIGAGSGFFETFLEENGFSTDGIICVEPDKKMFKKCEFRNKILCRAEALPFEDGRFDSVFCLDAIHLIDDVSDIFRVLKKNGKILVSIFFNKENLQEKEKMILDKFIGTKLLEKKIIHGKENELAILFQKS